MKTYSNTLLEKLSNQAMNLLLKEVKEEPDIENRRKNKGVFTSADLWKVHQSKRHFAGRRFYSF